ncbi:MAG: hypothetical protein K2Y37_12520 [Pirellulales bacterium]|nr:hypothetical protein [Pirellulales bacterium]
MAVVARGTVARSVVAGANVVAAKAAGGAVVDVATSVDRKVAVASAVEALLIVTKTRSATDRRDGTKTTAAQQPSQRRAKPLRRRAGMKNRGISRSSNRVRK